MVGQRIRKLLSFEVLTYQQRPESLPFFNQLLFLFKAFSISHPQ